ncbi:hypothetical protein TrLO_g11091 [Triparma laevis f. longispina]|uniref:Uncharacterized protein n=1 Tax=Triparma laevis f. longispina TaxID=1714387 RepID=A0A9W7KVG1_9STRA|nr:hypothetical protein TrLO_g11091 [Triparma laevis f. longispina]
MLTELPHLTRFSYGANADPTPTGVSTLASTNNLPRVPSPSINLPSTLSPAAKLEMEHFVNDVTSLSHFTSVKRSSNKEGAFGDICEYVTRLCDFTAKGYQFAFTMQWAAWTQTDQGGFILLSRTVKKSTPTVLLQNGCGEMSSEGNEATGKQVQAILKRMNFTSTTIPEFLATLLCVAGPNFLKTSMRSNDHDVEMFLGDKMMFFKEVGELLKRRKGDEEEEKDDDEEEEKKEQKA